MHDTTIGEAERWEKRAAELRHVLELMPPYDDSHPDGARARARVAARLRACETRAFRLRQRRLFDAK